MAEAPPAGDVVVVGDVMVDVVAHHDGPIEPGSDSPAHIRTVGGGSAANTACWLASLGTSVRLVAAVGDDPVGHAAVEELDRAGVAFAGACVPDRATGTCVVLVDAVGERTMLPDRGANDALSPDVVLAALSRPPGWVHLSGYALLDAGSRPAGLAALDWARRAGVPVSVDASSSAPLEAVGASRFLDWVRGCAVLFANDDEVAALGGADACTAAATVLVAKHGAAGSSWVDALTHVSNAAEPVTVVDTVGAGDAFDAGVIAALVRRSAPADALAQGAQVAARAVSQVGARP